MAKGAFWRLAAPPLAAPAAAAGAAAAGPAAAIALFLPESRRDVKPRGTCFWRSFHPSVAWCFGVAKGAFWKLAAPAPAAPLAACSGSSSSSSSSSSSRQQQLQSLCFYQNPCFLRSFRPSVAWCFGVAKGAFWGLAAPPLAARPAAAAGAAGAAAAVPAAAIALFLPESRRDVKPRGSVFFEVVSSFSSMVFWCGDGCVLEACRITSSSSTSSSSRSSSRPSSCNRFVYSRIQKGRQASGHMFLEVVPSFGSMMFRCGEGCVLEACRTSSSSTTSSMQREQQQQQ